MNLLAWSLSDLTNVDTETVARVAAACSAMALAGVIWLILNMYKLARNQVKLSMMLEELLRDRRK